MTRWLQLSITARGHHQDTISRPVAFRKQGKKRRVAARCGPAPGEPVVDRYRWISRRCRGTRSTWSSRRCSPFLRGRLSGRSEAHAEIASRAQLRVVFFQRHPNARAQMQIEGCRSQVESLSSLMRQQASLSSVRPFSCDGRMIAVMISPSVR